MSVFDRIFGAQPPVQQTQPANAPTPNPNPNANNAPIPGVDANNPLVPSGTPAAQPNPQDPFKDFNGLWDIDLTKVNPNEPFFAKTDPAKVMESARKTNFANMTQEQMTAIAAGGPEAVKAMQAILNGAAQSVYGQGAIASTKMIDQALSAQRKQFEDMLPGLITKHQASSGLQQSNPLFSNPTLAPMVEMVQERILAKNPNATPQEIQQQTSLFFDTMGVQFAPKPQASTNPAQRETDWGAYMGDTF